MKVLNNTLTIVSILLLSIMVGCKKKNAVPDLVTTEIAASELLDYYIVAERRAPDQKLVLIYFTKEANLVKANVHLQGHLRVAEATVNNSKFTFDLNTDGEHLYTFDLQKDANGLIKLKSYQYVNKSDGKVSLNYAVLVKKTECPTFANYSYKSNNVNFRLTNTSSILWDVVTRPIYSLANLGFKSNSDEFFGISVPYWDGSNAPLLLLEVNGTLWRGIKQ